MSAKASATVLKFNPLMEATELLRDLIRSAEWLIESQVAAESSQWEIEELRHYLGEAKAFVQDRDNSDSTPEDPRQPSLYA
jgi:hypothetical protein